MNTPLTPKRRTRGHVIADLSVNHAERQVLLGGHTVERVRADYGYDLLLFTFDANGEPEAGEVRVQVKATDSLRSNVRRGTVPFRIDRSDLAHWLTERVPVLLIVCDARAEAAYWIDVKDYFRRLSGFNLFAIGQTITIHIPRSSTLDQSATGQIVARKNQTW